MWKIHQTLKTTLVRFNVLNWWQSIIPQSLEMAPLRTKADGNCLLHATSLLLRGFGDQDSKYRKALSAFISSNQEEKLKERWRLNGESEQAKCNFQRTEEEFEEEWREVKA